MGEIYKTMGAISREETNMKISQAGLDLIKSFEGCSLKAYRCPAGVLTIGYGCTVGVKEGQTITQAEADSMLTKELSRFEDAVNRLGVTLNQNQFDALVSFCYNLGTGIFTGNLLNAIKVQNWSSVAEQILLYNKARVNGKLTELKGLTRRRKAERDLFIKSVSPQEDKELFEAVRKIILSGVNLNINVWKRLDLINLNNVPSLLNKLGGIDRLVAKGIISDKELWLKGQYNANHVKSLLIKYAAHLR